MRSQLGDMVAELSQGEYRESVIACRELTWLWLPLVGQC